MTVEKAIYLKPKKEVSILRRHPWVFSGAIRAIEGAVQAGDLVAVHANKGRLLGYGHYSPGASIAVRMLTFNDEEIIDQDWWNSKVRSAVDMRKQLGLMGVAGNSICRLIHAEGDGASGLIVDYYDRVAVIQTHSAGMREALDSIQEALIHSLGTELVGIYNKSAKPCIRSATIAAEPHTGHGS